MLKTTTWTTNQYSISRQPHETDGLFYAQGLYRYRKFQSPLSIKFCLEGQLNYIFKNERLAIPAGSFYLTNKDTELECLPNEPGYKALILFLTEELMQDVFRCQAEGEGALLDNPCADSSPVHFFEHVYRAPNPLSPRLQALARQMQAEKTSKHGLGPGLFYELAERLLLFQGNAKRQMESIEAKTLAIRRELYRRVLTAREYLYHHWDASLALQDAARQACLSPYHFHRTFRAAFGCSPMRWFRQRKLQKGKELLQSGRLSVSETAYRCGYADLATFSKAFKREWGVSPSAVDR